MITNFTLNKSRYFIFLLLFIPIFITCSRDPFSPLNGNSSVIINFTMKDDRNGESLNLNILHKTTAIAKVTLTIEAGDISTISKELSQSGNNWAGTVDVKKGNNRTFKIAAKDVNNVTQYEGTTTANLQNDTENISITLTPLYPTAVSLSVTSTTSTSVSLSWTKNYDSDFYAYWIYRSTTGTIDPYNSSQKVKEIKDKTTTNYIDNNLTSNITYYYAVYVIDTENLGSRSNLVNAKTSQNAVRLTYDDGSFEKTINSTTPKNGFLVKFSPTFTPCYIDSIHFYLTDNSGENGNYRVSIYNSLGNQIFWSGTAPTAPNGWVHIKLNWNNQADGTVTNDFYAGFVYEKSNGWPLLGRDTSSSSKQRSYFYNYSNSTSYLMDNTDPPYPGNIAIRVTVKSPSGNLLKITPDEQNSNSVVNSLDAIKIIPSTQITDDYTPLRKNQKFDIFSQVKTVKTR